MFKEPGSTANQSKSFTGPTATVLHREKNLSKDGYECTAMQALLELLTPHSTNRSRAMTKTLVCTEPHIDRLFSLRNINV